MERVHVGEVLAQDSFVVVFTDYILAIIMFHVGLCDNEKCYITLMMIIITIIAIIFWMTSILFGAFLISKKQSFE